MCTLYCQKDKVTHMPEPEQVYTQATNFMSLTCPLFVGPNHDKWYIFNMDQTPLYFSSKAQDATSGPGLS